MVKPSAVLSRHPLESVPPSTPESHEKFRGRSIIEIDDMGGDAALYECLHARLMEAPLDPLGQLDVMDTTNFMLAMHGGATRSDGKDHSYNGHLLRTTLKLIECGVYEPAMLKAQVGHDVVENHPEKVVAHLQHLDPRIGSDDIQQEALRLMGIAFGQEMADLVGDVTNPPYTSQERTI